MQPEVCPTLHEAAQCLEGRCRRRSSEALGHLSQNQRFQWSAQRLVARLEFGR